MKLLVFSLLLSLSCYSQSTLEIVNKTDMTIIMTCKGTWGNGTYMNPNDSVGVNLHEMHLDEYMPLEIPGCLKFYNVGPYDHVPLPAADYRVEIYWDTTKCDFYRKLYGRRHPPKSVVYDWEVINLKQ